MKNWLTNKEIFLPSGNLKFNWVAVEDVARVAKKALLNHLPQPAVEITSDQISDLLPSLT